MHEWMDDIKLGGTAGVYVRIIALVPANLFVWDKSFFAWKCPENERGYDIYEIRKL